MERSWCLSKKNLLFTEKPLSSEGEKVFDKTEKPWNYLTNEYDSKNLTWLFGDEKGGILHTHLFG